MKNKGKYIPITQGKMTSNYISINVIIGIKQYDNNFYNLMHKCFLVMIKKWHLYLLPFILLSCKLEEPKTPPNVVTMVASDVTLKNATLNGEVTEEGFSATTDRGFVFSEKNTSPSVSDSKAQSGYGKGVYSVVLDKLTVNSKYYFKAYATNTKGTSYGVVQSFTTADYNLVNISTDVPKSIGYTSVNLWGVVLGNGGGNVSERGFVVGENPSPTTLDFKFSVSSGGLGEYTLFISTLKVGTKYYVRAYAINEKGISYGNTQSFTTLDFVLPTSSTNIPQNIGYSTVEILGSVTDEGGGSVSESGFVYGLNPKPTINENKISIAKGKGDLRYWVTKLLDNTKYFVRTYAINEKGVSYGNEQSFTTLKVNTVTSKTGRIWMDRNLGATQVATSLTDEASFGDLYQWGRLTDGHQLRTSSSTNTTSSLNIPGNPKFIINNAYPWDWKIPQNANFWQGVNGINNVCPTGFRIPTSEEWITEIKSWNSSNANGGYESSLKLPMGGNRGYSGIFGNIGNTGLYWTSTIQKVDGGDFYSQMFRLTVKDTGGYNYHRAGANSVRCIKD